MKIKNILALAALAVAPVIAIVGTEAASASTPACISGTYAGYCGTQVNPGNVPLALDVYQQRASYNNKVIGFGDILGDPGTDLFTFAFNGGSDKIFEYAPKGVASNYCLSEPSNSAGVVLRVCNGSSWQRFDATAVYPVTASSDSGSAVLGYATALPKGSADVLGTTVAGYVWANTETGDVLSTNGLRGQVTGVPDPTKASTPGFYTITELFNFVG